MTASADGLRPNPLADATVAAVFADSPDARYDTTDPVEGAQPDEAQHLRPESARAVSTARPCEACNSRLTGGRPHRRYCNGRCRARASRERRARELLERIGHAIEAAVADSEKL